MDKKAALGLLSILFICIGGVNFCRMMAVDNKVGSAYQENGQYFARNDGELREITEAQWRRLQWSEYSVCISHPLAMMGMGYLLLQLVFPAVMYQKTEGEIAQTVAEVEQSGKVIKTTRCSGEIGMVHFSGSIIRARIYPGGLVIKPILMPSLAVRWEQIESVEDYKRFLANGIEIKHTSPEVAKPLILRCQKDWGFCNALDDLVARKGQSTTQQ